MIMVSSSSSLPTTTRRIGWTATSKHQQRAVLHLQGGSNFISIFFIVVCLFFEVSDSFLIVGKTTYTDRPSIRYRRRSNVSTRTGTGIVVLQVHERQKQFQLSMVDGSEQDNDSIDDNDNDNDENEDQVTDAEALLACYAYLRKTKRMGIWTKHEERKAMRAAAEPHFFWEHKDGENFNPNKKRLLDADGIDDYDFDDDEKENDDDDDDDDFLERQYMGSSPDNGTDRQREELLYGQFSSFPKEPEPSTVRRSESAKRYWSDPEFRKKWYEKRWGKKREEEERKSEKEVKRVQAKLKSLPGGFFGSNELATLTEEEIEHAIRSYTKGRERRVRTRTKTLAEQKAALDVVREVPEEDVAATSSSSSSSEKILDRDSLLLVDEDALRRAQEERSERSRRLYAKRKLNNPPASKKVSNYQVNALPDTSTPQAALRRVTRALDLGEFPTTEDVRLLLIPLKLSRRKEVFKRILNELFDLHGKCIPADLTDPESEKIFITQSSIESMGSFVLKLLTEREQSKKD